MTEQSVFNSYVSFHNKLGCWEPEFGGYVVPLMPISKYHLRKWTKANIIIFFNSASICHRFTFFSECMFCRVLKLNKLVTNNLSAKYQNPSWLQKRQLTAATNSVIHVWYPHSFKGYVICSLASTFRWLSARRTYVLATPPPPDHHPITTTTINNGHLSLILCSTFRGQIQI